MTTEDLDRILASEEPLLPSSGFAASVMERVREATTAPPPLPFPWRRFAYGLLLLSVSAGLCGWMLVTLGAATPLQAALLGTFAALGNLRVTPLLGMTLASLLGTYVLFVLTLRFTGARR